MSEKNKRSTHNHAKINEHKNEYENKRSTQN